MIRKVGSETIRKIGKEILRLGKLSDNIRKVEGET